MQIEQLPIGDLVPYARNSRVHSAAQVASVVESIRAFGFTSPVLIRDDGQIIAGHGRVMAAQKMGMSEVPCIRLGHLTDEQARAYVLADNKLSEMGTWDEELLALELKDLRDAGFELGLTGFSDDEIADLTYVESTGNTDPDEVPAVQDEAVTQPGDVWVLGRHRIMCGDSTDAGSVALLMGGAMGDLCFTSPPYNLGKSVGLRNGARKGADSAYNEFSDDADWLPMMRGFMGVALNVSSVLCVNVQMLSGNKFDLLGLFGEFAENTVDVAIWSKTNPQPAMADGVLTSAFEFMWFLSSEKKPNRRIKTASFKRGTFSNVFSHATASGHDASVHGAVFPSAVAVNFIANCSKSGGLIYEPFSGSGTTIIAAEQTGRRCYAMEISPQYVDVAVRRWQQFTGKRAVHAVTGLPFPEKVGAGETAH
jgi:DNA modification methylase